MEEILSVDRRRTNDQVELFARRYQEAHLIKDLWAGLMIPRYADCSFDLVDMSGCDLASVPFCTFQRLVLSEAEAVGQALRDDVALCIAGVEEASCLDELLDFWFVDPYVEHVGML